MSYQKQDQTPQWGDQYYNMDSVQDDPRTIIVPSLHWIHTWSPNFLSTIKVGALFYKWEWVPTTEQGRNSLYWLWDNNTNYNGTGFEDLYQRNRYQLNADGTLFLDNLAGGHELKFGIQSNFNNTRRLVNVFGPMDSGGLVQLYLYHYLDAGNPVPYYAAWAAGFSQRTRAMNIGFFLNDSWSVTKRLTVSLGLRFDYNWNFTPAQKGSIDPDVPNVGNLGYIGYPELTWDMDIEETVNNFKWHTFSPRLGLIYDLRGNGKTVLKANFAQYTMDNYTATTWYVTPVGWIWVEGYTNPDNPTGDVSEVTYAS
ncbi:MAG: TonB-dependent receptor, partial [Acidobacteriota bacterium]|nr:TonB-dependent receptor [Acidobacteriota bacterium]